MNADSDKDVRNVVGEDSRVSSGYRIYALILLCLMFFLSYADRQLVGVLISPIKREFNLSDTVLGMLSGLTFGLFYGVSSVPLARIADRGSRKVVLTICLALWSCATMASGMTSSAVQLVIARASVGIGEAGGTPSAIAMISDLFSRAHRGLAIAIYNAAGSFGGAAVMSVGAWIAAAYGWRMAFIVVGFPGLFLAALIALTIREPVRGESDGDGRARAAAAPAYTLGETLRHIFGQRALSYTMLASGLSSAVVACTAWLPSFFERSHGLSLVQAGGAVGIALLISGPLGELLGGQLTDRLASRGDGAVMRATTVVVFTTVVASLALVLMPSVIGAIAVLVVWKIFATAYVPSAWGLSQSLVEPGMRATSQSITGIYSNLLGYGCGPFVVGTLSEVFRPAFGEESLRWALGVGMTTIGLLSTLFFFLAARWQTTHPELSHPPQART